jgi:hypothetical protein
MDLASIRRLTELGDFVIPFSIRVVSELGIADQLVAGPRTVDDLAAATGAHAPTLLRVLRALARHDLFEELEDERFALTQMAKLLLSGGSSSLRAAYPYLTAEIEAWVHADWSVRTGGSAFEHVHGQRYYDYLAAHPDHSVRVDRMVHTLNAVVGRSVIQAYDWSGIATLVDVGGGDGAFLAFVLAQHATLRGILYDLPHVLERAPEVLRRAGVEERCTIVGGSFFDGVPAGADAYLLKTILHDWPDERVLVLLREIRRAIAPGGRLLLIEPLLADGNAFDIGKLIDVNSLVLVEGPDRTREQLARLLTRSGFDLATTTPTASALTIFDARPSPDLPAAAQ